MKRPNRKTLRKTAEAHNRKAYKKELIKSLKNICKLIEEKSKCGETKINISIDSNRDDYIFYKNWICVRYLRRYTDLEVIIHENVVYLIDNSNKYVDKIYGSISW